MIGVSFWLAHDGTWKPRETHARFNETRAQGFTTKAVEGLRARRPPGAKEIAAAAGTGQKDQPTAVLPHRAADLLPIGLTNQHVSTVGRDPRVEPVFKQSWRNLPAPNETYFWPLLPCKSAKSGRKTSRNFSPNRLRLSKQDQSVICCNVPIPSAGLTYPLGNHWWCKPAASHRTRVLTWQYEPLRRDDQ